MPTEYHLIGGGLYSCNAITSTPSMGGYCMYALGGITNLPHTNPLYGGNGVECDFHTCKKEISASIFTVWHK